MEPFLSLPRLIPLLLTVICFALLFFGAEVDGSVIPKPAEDHLNSVLDLLNSAKSTPTSSVVVPPAVIPPVIPEPVGDHLSSVLGQLNSATASATLSVVIPPVIPEPVGDHLSSVLSLLHSATASAVVPPGSACPVPDPAPDVTPAPPPSSAVAPAPPLSPLSPPPPVSTPKSKSVSTSKPSQTPTLTTSTKSTKSTKSTTSTKSSTKVAESLSPQPTAPIHALSIVADFRVKGDCKDTFTWTFFYTPYGQAVGCRRNYAISVEEPMKYSPDTCKLGGTYDMVLYGKSCMYKNNGHSTGKLFCGDQTIDCKKDVNNPAALQGALNPMPRNPLDGNVVSKEGVPLSELYWVWYDNPGQYSCDDDERVPMFTCEW